MCNPAKEKIELDSKDQANDDQNDIKQEGAKNEESGRRNTPENEVESNRSSVSGQSTTENESSLKKESIVESKEGQVQAEDIQQSEEDNKKDIESICNKILSIYSRENLDYGCIKF